MLNDHSILFIAACDRDENYQLLLEHIDKRWIPKHYGGLIDDGRSRGLGCYDVSWLSGCGLYYEKEKEERGSGWWQSWPVRFSYQRTLADTINSAQQFFCCRQC